MYMYCDRPSKSAKLLAKGLGCKKGTRIPLKNYKHIINWGCTKGPALGNLWLNRPECLLKAVDKLQFFQAMEPLGITPRFYTDSQEALNAIVREKEIVCRTALRSHSGRGIVIASTREELIKAPLYVEYIKKDTEWRVHVVKNAVIDIQRKARNRDIPDNKVNWKIRNHQNGFIYVRGDIEDYNKNMIEKIKDYALKTVEITHLDFGAVDIICTKLGKPYILEVNTAPGLEGTTLNNYIKAFKEL